jgi:F-type H+-transporting ATPase subunit b
MAETDAATATGVVVAVAPAHGAEASDGIMGVSVSLMGLTWVTFLLVALVLYRVAWKPILLALDQRERGIRRALDDAEQARQAAAETETRNRDLLAQAEAQARQIMAEARAQAQATAQALEAQAAADAQALIAEARRDIQAAAEAARTGLRQECAALAVTLAGKVVEANLDSARNRALVDSGIKEL